MDPMTMMALAGLASSAAGGMGVGATKGSQGQFAPQTAYLDDYANTVPRVNAQGNFLTDQFASMAGGELPAWLKKNLAIMQQGMSDQNNQTFFGTQGNRSGSVMDSARSTGAAMGTGPKSTNAQVSKQLTNFSNAEKQIGEYIASLGTQQGVNYQNMLMNASNQMPQGPRGQIFGGGTYSTQGSNPLGDLGKALGTAAPWMQWAGQGQNPQVGATAQNAIGGRSAYDVLNGPSATPGQGGYGSASDLGQGYNLSQQPMNSLLGPYGNVSATGPTPQPQFGVSPSMWLTNPVGAVANTTAPYVQQAANYLTPGLQKAGKAVGKAYTYATSPY